MKIQAFVKKNQKAIVVVAIVAIAFFLFTQKGKVIVEQLKTKGSGGTIKTKLQILWENSTAPIHTEKEVYFAGKKYFAPVKNIKGYDLALLRDGRVVLYENGASSWVPASENDLS